MVNKNRKLLGEELSRCSWRATHETALMENTRPTRLEGTKNGRRHVHLHTGTMYRTSKWIEGKSTEETEDEGLIGKFDAQASGGHFLSQVTAQR